MGIFHSDNLDQAVAQELFEDINDHYLISETMLIKLDRTPRDSELIHALFRSVHTIKGDLGIVGFSPAMPLITAVEDVLAMLRSGSLVYSPMLSDLILVVLDRVRGLVDGFREQGFVEYDVLQVRRLGEHISELTRLQGDQLEARTARIIRELDPSVVAGSDLLPEDMSRSAMRDAGALDDDEDIGFFRQLIVPVETRSPYWQGRSERILKLALILNQVGGRAVDDKQLTVAVYAHDFGMALMPPELLHKESTLNDTEIQLLRSHVQSSAHLLQHMEKWAPAREMVLQHHEAANGSGYPYGLRDKEICGGAKILAIADTFDAMTHNRAYSDHQKRPIIRAVKEINGLSGQQLSPHWVEVFNQAVQPVLIAHRARHF